MFFIEGDQKWNIQNNFIIAQNTEGQLNPFIGSLRPCRHPLQI